MKKTEYLSFIQSGPECFPHSFISVVKKNLTSEMACNDLFCQIWLAAFCRIWSTDCTQINTERRLYWRLKLVIYRIKDYIPENILKHGHLISSFHTTNIMLSIRMTHLSDTFYCNQISVFLLSFPSSSQNSVIDSLQQNSKIIFSILATAKSKLRVSNIHSTFNRKV